MTSILITGANRGLGLEFVRQLLSSSKPPKHLFACCRSPEKAEDLQRIADSNQAVTILKMDITDKTTMPAAVESVERIVGEEGLNVLINNAGIITRENCETTTTEEFETLHRVNVIGPLQVTQAFLPAIKCAAKSTSSDKSTMSINTAAIVNITSIMGCMSNNTSGISVAYKTSKAALNMLTNCMSHDFAQYGILAIAMHPGWVQTDMGGKHKAPVKPEDSIAGILNTLSKLRGIEASGRAYEWTGKVMTW